jgi:predicted Zn-dependent protease
MRAIILATAASAVILSGCQTVDTTKSTAVGVDRPQRMLVSSEQINASAEKAYTEVLAEAKKQNALDRDAAQVQRVKTIVSRLVPQTAAFREDAPKWKWETHVLSSKEVNAWCMPGGKIAVYSGIFPITQDENGMAVVLAHEISHALAHHGAERLSRSQLMQVGEAGLLAAVQAGKPEATQMAGAALGLGGQLGVELPFSRQQESEADHIGLVLMAKAGYDPAKAVDFWQRMLAYSNGKEPPAFLSDHPSSEQRIADIKRELPEAKAAFVAHK